MERSIEAFESQGVPVFKPGTEDYERSVATANLLFRFSRPDCVIQPETDAHVQTVVKRARSQGHKITIKCGGHSYAGHSTAFEGISLDLGRMKKVNLDIASMTVTIGAGCRWGDVYKSLINGKHNGFIINGGRCPFVGVSGFMLGGGLGPFTRTFGLGSDTLKEATIVTADGNLVTVSGRDDPNSKEGKLFWALRGAGGGNFGVLVQMKLNIMELRNIDGNVVAGRYTWFPKPRESFMTTMNDFYTRDWPREMTIDSTWVCDLRNREVKDIGIRFTIYYDGTDDEYKQLITEHIADLDLAKQLRRRVLPEKSTRFLHETLVAQWSEETTKAFPESKSYTIYSSFVFDNKQATIREVTAILEKEMEAFRRLFETEQVEFLATWIHAGGKSSERDPTDTAFFWRQGTFQTYITVEWNDKWMEKDMRGFFGRVKKKLRPFSLNGEAAFINFPDGVLSPRRYERAYFGRNVKELRRIKKMWDRENFFQGVQGIKPPNRADDDGGLGVDASDDEGATDLIARRQWEIYEPVDVMRDLAELAALGY